jgi:hypothetical protein
MTIIPKIYTDDGNGTTYTYSIINSTNYSGKTSIVQRKEGVTGNHNFWLELRWTGTDLCTVHLPIDIEFVIEPDEKN